MDYLTSFLSANISFNLHSIPKYSLEACFIIFLNIILYYLYNNFENEVQILTKDDKCILCDFEGNYTLKDVLIRQEKLKLLEESKPGTMCDYLNKLSKKRDHAHYIRTLATAWKKNFNENYKADLKKDKLPIIDEHCKYLEALVNLLKTSTTEEFLKFKCPILTNLLEMQTEITEQLNQNINLEQAGEQSETES